MFEHVVLRRSADGVPITLGQLAEAMLYYQKVHVILDRETVLSLIAKIGMNGVYTIIDHPDVSAVFCEEMLAVHTDPIGASIAHQFVAIRLEGDSETVGKIKTPADRLQFALERAGKDKKIARRFAQAFFDRVPVKNLSGDQYQKGGITKAAAKDMFDLQFSKIALQQALRAYDTTFLVNDNLRLELISSDLGFFVFTDLDLQLVNEKRARASLFPVTMAHLLTHILDARADLALASFYGGDFVTSKATSSIIQVKHTEFLKRSNINSASREEFIDHVIPNAPSLAEVIDSGDRSFDEFIKLLKRAKRFKGWIKSVNPDQGLIHSYIQEISSDDWLQSFPVKGLRYITTLGIDTAFPGLGQGAGILDALVMDRFLKGWRPNHFISGKLAPFVRPKR